MVKDSKTIFCSCTDNFGIAERPSMDMCGLQKKTFEKTFEKSLFNEKNVCIVEVGISNVDFLIVDIAYVLRLPIISFYDIKAHYTSILHKYYGEKNILVRSHLEDDEINIPGGIVDDIATMKSRSKYTPSTASFFVYRSDTCNVRDYYDFDLIIEVTPLRSGVTTHIDGNIRVFDRECVYYEVSYKVTKAEILYGK